MSLFVYLMFVCKFKSFLLNELSPKTVIFHFKHELGIRCVNRK